MEPIYHIRFYPHICLWPWMLSFVIFFRYFLSNSSFFSQWNSFIFELISWFNYPQFFFGLWCDWITVTQYMSAFTWFAFIKSIRFSFLISSFRSRSGLEIMNRPFEVVQLNAQYFAKLLSLLCVYMLDCYWLFFPFSPFYLFSRPTLLKV